MSCNGRVEIRRHIAAVATMMLLPAAVLLLPGCSGGLSGGLTGGTTPDTDGSAANFKGVVTGIVSDSRSTRESLDAAEAGGASQVLPPDIDPTRVRVTFEDLAGKVLRDALPTSEAVSPYPSASTVSSLKAFTPLSIQP